jgi:hypothetical protein
MGSKLKLPPPSPLRHSKLPPKYFINIDEKSGNKKITGKGV